MGLSRIVNVFNVSIVLLLAALFIYGGFGLFMLTYIVMYLFISFRVLQSGSRKRIRTMLIVAYFLVMILQMAFYNLVVTDDDPLSEFFAVVLLLLPMVVARYVVVNRAYLPKWQSSVTISFSQIYSMKNNIKEAIANIEKAGSGLSYTNFKEIIADLPRHDSFRYINSDSLTEEYFTAAKACADDPYLYIIISNTGTPASELIAVFTRKEFNHASLAFDAELQTIVSYNGGQRVYPPGLNHEMLSFFNSKSDASILIYRLPVTKEQKLAAIEKIHQINTDGSAYNLIGIFLGKSYKSNIMYCSQFVYSIIKHIGAEFAELTGVIKPTDLIEKDYYRNLEFVKELKL